MVLALFPRSLWQRPLIPQDLPWQHFQRILKEKKYNSFGSLRAYLLIVAWLKEEKHSSELELLQANIQDYLKNSLSFPSSAVIAWLPSLTTEPIVCLFTLVPLPWAYRYLLLPFLFFHMSLSLLHLCNLCLLYVSSFVLYVPLSLLHTSFPFFMHFLSNKIYYAIHHYITIVWRGSGNDIV